MDRMIPTEIGGKTVLLNFSMEIFFDVIEKYGSVAQLMKAIDAGGRSGFEAVRWVAVQMANDGELCRRAAGYDAQRMLSENDISLRMAPAAYTALLNAVIEAIAAGFKREAESKDEEVDLGLAELNAKKEKAGV